MSLSSGMHLGPYEILAPLGAGGMGEVYRARDRRLEREVALKVLPAGVSADPERLRRFEKEARAASSLSHPNVVTVYDIGESGGTSFLAVELVDGSTLRERRAELWKEVSVADPTGVNDLVQIRFTPDGKSYAYSFERHLSRLYAVEGMR
jgi:serine/threonine protein kinase